jgi:hypothetical protein
MFFREELTHRGGFSSGKKVHISALAKLIADSCFHGSLPGILWYTDCDREVREMQVGCTRKLLDYIGVIAEPVDVQLDPILSWSANTMTINHHRAIVIANDSSRYGFVLYGIKSKDIKEFGHLVVDGVRACLETECIDPSLIQRYIFDCGEHVTFTKTANRSVVTRLNQLCTYGVMW